MTFVFVVQAVVVPSGKARVFAIAIHFGVSVLLVGAVDPFVSRWHSLLAIGAGTISGAQILYALSREEDITLFGLGTAVQVTCVALAVGAVVWHAFRSRKSRSVGDGDESVLARSQGMSTRRSSSVAGERGKTSDLESSMHVTSADALPDRRTCMRPSGDFESAPLETIQRRKVVSDDNLLQKPIQSTSRMSSRASSPRNPRRGSKSTNPRREDSSIGVRSISLSGATMGAETKAGKTGTGRHRRRKGVHSQTFLGPTR